MQTEQNSFENLPIKIIAGAVVIACLAVGIIGLVMPVIPGLLFLAIAAVVGAKYSPALDRMLRRNATIGGYLDRTDGLVDLPLAKKVQLGCLLFVKVLIDGVTFLVSNVMRLVRAAERA
jgi:uncharacterized membrane protein YbaN (DUF454 family)